MDFITCIRESDIILMEGALGERLKREYHLKFDENVVMAGLAYDIFGRKALLELWREYLAIAEKYDIPFIATSPSRRANQERVAKSKYEAAIIYENMKLLQQVKADSKVLMYVGGLMGSRGNAYDAGEALATNEAKVFHSWQVNLYQQAGADFIYAAIMPALTECIGMAQAIEETKLPYIMSFMIRKDGRLLDGTTIHDAIDCIDRTVKQKPVCYITNCVHPTILMEALQKPFNQTKLVWERFLGIQANTSALSPEELDGCLELKSSDANALANDMLQLNKIMQLKIIGGCCGTDGSHIEAMAKQITRDKIKI